MTGTASANGNHRVLNGTKNKAIIIEPDAERTRKNRTRVEQNDILLHVIRIESKQLPAGSE